jgi:hypothetical protein
MSDGLPDQGPGVSQLGDDPPRHPAASSVQPRLHVLRPARALVRHGQQPGIRRLQLFGRRLALAPREAVNLLLLWVKYRRKRMVTTHCHLRNAWLAFVCRKSCTHPVTSGFTMSTNSCGRCFSRFRIFCWADFAGKMSMVVLPRLGLLRFTNWKPMQSKPSGNRSTSVLSRLTVRATRVAIASSAARTGCGRLRHTTMASSAWRCRVAPSFAG